MVSFDWSFNGGSLFRGVEPLYLKLNVISKEKWRKFMKSLWFDSQTKRIQRISFPPKEKVLWFDLTLREHLVFESSGTYHVRQSKMLFDWDGRYVCPWKNQCDLTWFQIKLFSWLCKRGIAMKVQEAWSLHQLKKRYPFRSD